MLKDDSIIDIVLAAVVSNMLEGDPLWMLLIAPPSSAKTELLRALVDCPNIFLISSLTPTTFISGMKTPKNKNPGLLFQLDEKILVVKDFGTIMTLRSEQRAEILSQLREIYDGNFSKAFGTGKTIRWEGKVGLIAGATPIIDTHSSVNQALGERFLQCRIKGDNRQEVARKARQSAGKEEQMRNELRGVYGAFLSQFEDIQGQRVNIELKSDIEEKIVNLACLCAQARTAVIRDRYTQAIEVLPEAEGPGRLIKQFVNLGISLTLIHQKESLDEDIYKILKRVGRDTLPALRMRIIDVLWDAGAYQGEGGDWLKTREVANISNLPTSTARLRLENLQSMNLVDRDIRNEDGEDTDKTIPYRWRLSNECCQLLERTDLTSPHDGEKSKLKKDDAPEDLPF